MLLALRMIDAIDAELDLLRAELAHLSRRQPGCAALRDLYGIGPITAVAIWAEFGDVRRFSSSRHAVRHTGLDVTVYASDDKRAPGHLARQGPAVLRWALFEAARCRPGRLTRPRLPPAARAGRRRAGAGGRQPPIGRGGGLTVPAVRALPTTLMCGGLLPPVPCRHAHALVGPKRSSGRTHPASGVTPSSIMSPGEQPAHQDKAGRPRTAAHRPPPIPSSEVVTVH